MKRLAALVVLLLTSGIGLMAADRIFTNPKPEGHFKKLFPNAVAFSNFGGSPLHWKAYGADPAKTPSAKPIGYAYWTLDIVPEERGYHGHIHMLVGLTPQGRIAGVIMDINTEPYGDISINLPDFPNQFKGKSIRDKFEVGQDVDLTSRATITVRAAARELRESSRIVARAVLNPADLR